MLAVALLGPHPIPQTGNIQVDGTILHYVVEGHGTPCLVIGSSVYYPRTFSKNLRQHLQLIFVDMRWFSPKLKPIKLTDFTLDVVVRDIDLVRKRLKLERPIFMGHSIHGSIAFEYAKRHPEHVSRLVLIGAPVLMTSPRYDESTTEIWKSASAERQALQTKNWSHLPDFAKHPELQPDVENYLAMAPKYWFNPRYDARWLWRGMTIHSPMLHHLYDGMFRNYDMFGASRSVPAPTFVATGLCDFIVPHTSWDACRDIPNLSVNLFEQAGHTPQLESPKEFDQKLLAWLAHGLP